MAALLYIAWLLQQAMSGDASMIFMHAYQGSPRETRADHSQSSSPHDGQALPVTDHLQKEASLLTGPFGSRRYNEATFFDRTLYISPVLLMPASSTSVCGIL